MLRDDRAVADAAMSAFELASRGDGYHPVSITDALIAAAAAEHGGLAVLHKDRHLDRLAQVLAFRERPAAGRLTAQTGGPTVQVA